MHTALKIAAALLLTALAACVTPIETDPDTFRVEPAAASQLRGPQTVALNNAYKTAREVTIGRNMSADLRQLTETAIIMLGRAMEKQGIRVMPQADKTVTLRVHRVSVGIYGLQIAPQYPAKLVLEVEYLNGKKTSIEALNVAPYSPWRATGGAILFALNDLVRHEQFVAYINDYRPTEADLARRRGEAAAAVPVEDSSSLKQSPK